MTARVVFDVMNPQTGSAGSIKKVWSGVIHEMVAMRLIVSHVVQRCGLVYSHIPC